MIELLVVLLVVGVVIAMVPLDQTIRNIIVAVVALFVVFWILNHFGIVHGGLKP